MPAGDAAGTVAEGAGEANYADGPEVAMALQQTEEVGWQFKDENDALEDI